MNDYPLQFLAFALIDRVVEPFSYGCATFVLSYPLTRTTSAKVLAIGIGVLAFLWMDDVWPKLAFDQAQMGLASADPALADVISDEPEVGDARFHTGDRSPLFAVSGPTASDVASALLFVPAGFLLGLLVTRRGRSETGQYGVHEAQRSEQSVHVHGQQVTIASEPVVEKARPTRRIHVRLRTGEKQECTLGDVNAMLSRGELDGDEAAWMPGLATWIALRVLPGVIVPMPPPLRDLSSEGAPPTRPIDGRAGHDPQTAVNTHAGAPSRESIPAAPPFAGSPEAELRTRGTSESMRASETQGESNAPAGASTKRAVWHYQLALLAYMTLVGLIHNTLTGSAVGSLLVVRLPSALGTALGALAVAWIPSALTVGQSSHDRRSQRFHVVWGLVATAVALMSLMVSPSR